MAWRRSSARRNRIFPGPAPAITRLPRLKSAPASLALHIVAIFPDRLARKGREVLCDIVGKVLAGARLAHIDGALVRFPNVFRACDHARVGLPQNTRDMFRHCWRPYQR